MKTLVQKINTMVTLTAALLLTTVGLSAQTYQDDVYYSPSKNTSKKKVVQPKKDVRKEAKRTYRATHEVEDFSTAQQRYAKMLSEKQKESSNAKAYDETESWVYNTQGLTKKQDIQKEISLYNRGNVNADNPDADTYYEDDYVLWQPVKVTRVYTQPHWYSNFYFDFNFGWGDVYYHPYNYGYYSRYYWDDYYSYWGDYYAPYYRWHRPYWSSYYGHIGWRDYYSPHYYYQHYYNPYCDYGGYGNYYNSRYYHDNYEYKQRPQEFSDDITNTYRRNAARAEQARDASAANFQRERAENMNRRYSSDIYRRRNVSENTPELRQNIDSNTETYRRGDSRISPTIAGSSNGDTMYQRENAYTRRIEDSRNEYRRRSTITPRRSVENVTEGRQIYRNDFQEYRRINENTNIHKTDSESYRRVTTPSRRNSSQTYRSSAPLRDNNSSYRRSAPTPVRSSESYRRPAPSRRTYSTPNRSSSPSRSNYRSPSRNTSPSRSNNNTNYRR